MKALALGVFFRSLREGLRVRRSALGVALSAGCAGRMLLRGGTSHATIPKHFPPRRITEGFTSANSTRVFPSATSLTLFTSSLVANIPARMPSSRPSSRAHSPELQDVPDAVDYEDKYRRLHHLQRPSRPNSRSRSSSPGLFSRIGLAAPSLEVRCFGGCRRVGERGS